MDRYLISVLCKSCNTKIVYIEIFASINSSLVRKFYINVSGTRRLTCSEFKLYQIFTCFSIIKTLETNAIYLSCINIHQGNSTLQNSTTSAILYSNHPTVLCIRGLMFPKIVTSFRNGTLETCNVKRTENIDISFYNTHFP